MSIIKKSLNKFSKWFDKIMIQTYVENQNNDQGYEFSDYRHGNFNNVFSIGLMF